MGITKTSDYIQINIKMPNPSQEPPASSKAPNEDLKDMDVLCTFKIKIESQNFDHGYIKDQWPYQNQYQEAKLQSGTSSPHQSTKSGLKGYGFSLHLQNQDSEPKFWSWLYPRPVTISKVILRFQTPVMNLHYHPKPHIRTWRTWMFLAPSKSNKRAKFWIIGVSKTSDHILINIKIQNPSQEPQASSKAPKQDLKNMDVLCTYKINIERVKIKNIVVTKTTGHR